MENQNNKTSRANKMLVSTLTSIRRTRDYVINSNHRSKNTLLSIISVMEETLLNSDIDYLVNNVRLVDLAMYLLGIQTELVRVKHIADS